MPEEEPAVVAASEEVPEAEPVVPEAPPAILPAAVALQADSTDRVLVTWPDQISFRADFDSHLQWNGLKIPTLHPWGVYTPLLLTLAHPTGDRLELRARVVANFGEETALEIELVGEERAKIRDWAGL